MNIRTNRFHGDTSSIIPPPPLLQSLEVHLCVAVLVVSLVLLFGSCLCCPLDVLCELAAGPVSVYMSCNRSLVL